MKTKRHLKELIVWRTNFTDTFANIESFIIGRLQDEYLHLKFDKYRVDLHIKGNCNITIIRDLVDKNTAIKDIEQQLEEAIFNMFNFIKGKDLGDLEDVEDFEAMKLKEITIGIKIEIEKF